MLENRSRSSAGAGPGRIVVALLLACAVAFAVHTVLNRRASQAASTAELSFDAGAARQVDAGLAAGADPAVALAQSILTDGTIAGLSKQAYLSSNGMANRIGEFRSRLELTQPSAGTLRVGFRDPDPVKAAETANTVAKALAAWTPGAVLAGAAAPSSQPAAATAPGALEGTSAPPPTAPAPERAVPPPAKVARNGGIANHGLSDALGQLGAELSATNRKLEGGGSAGRASAGHPSGGYGSHEEASYSQSRQQQMLKSEVRTAEKKLDDLRAQYANQSAPGGDRQAGVKERLAAIQGALTAVWPGRGATRNAHGFYSAGTSASQIRQERAALVEAIGVVGRQVQAIRKEEDAAATSDVESEGAAAAAAPAPSPAPSAAASPASSAGSEPGAGSEPAASAPGSTPNATPNPAPQPAPLPAAAGSSAASGQPRPLTMARAAGAAPPVSWLPAVGAGLLFGLLSLGIAAWRNRPVEYAEAEEEVTPTRSGYRLITPDRPAAAESVAAATMTDFEYFGSGGGAGSSRRASFSYEPPPVEGAAPEPGRPVEESTSAGAESFEASHEPGAVVMELSPPGELHESQETSPAKVDNATGSAEKDDGWTNLIQKAILETDIAKRFEKAGDEGGEAGGQRSNFTGRKAG